MSGVDIFIAALSAVMFFGGLYLNFKSRRLVDQYNEEHRKVTAIQKNVRASRKRA
ncbi:MAG: hypothetical protein QME45_12155 [Clostridiales bacterium]|nr:hypothetical protein [Clostridiales bacterium]